MKTIPSRIQGIRVQRQVAKSPGRKDWRGDFAVRRESACTHQMMPTNAVSKCNPSLGAFASLRLGVKESSASLRLNLFAAALLLARVCSTLAEVHYVDVNSANATPPYTNWATAARNIQDAVDAAVAGDEVAVTNGTYATGGRPVNGEENIVDVDKPIGIRSVNGPLFTVIQGYDGFADAIRCAYLTNGASLSGFTLKGGGTFGNGGGLLCQSRAAVVSNCVVSGNSALYQGGGVYGGTLNNCTLSGNAADYYGGGAYSSTLNSCTLRGNTVGASLSGRELPVAGAGAAYCTLNNCTLTGNSAIPHSYSQCEYWCYTDGVPFCCRTRLVESSAYGGGAYSCTLNNCIIYFNTDNTDGGNFDYSCRLNHCCTSPQQANGSGNIAGDPLFEDYASGDIRLQSNSPCVNAGSNAFAPAGPELDGNPRIAGGTVDIGAYEFQSPISQISYAWLQQYGLPISSSTDTVDSDGDGVDNYHEWLAGTDPRNALSSPAQLAITPSWDPRSGIILTWSTNAVGFTLQSTTNLLSPSAWVTNSSTPVVTAGQNTVTNRIAGAQQFYRLIH